MEIFDTFFNVPVHEEMIALFKTPLFSVGEVILAALLIFAFFMVVVEVPLGAIVVLVWRLRGKDHDAGKSDPSFTQPSIGAGVDYTLPSEAEVVKPLERVRDYFVRSTPYRIVDTATGKLLWSSPGRPAGRARPRRPTTRWRQRSRWCRA